MMELEYDIVYATEDHKEEVAEFMRQYYYPHELLNVALNAPPNRPTDEIHGIPYISEGMSFLAVSKTNRNILGVCLNAEDILSSERPEKEKFNYSHEAYSKIDDFIRKVEGDIDLFKLTGCKKTFYVHMITVVPAAKGRGIGKALIERSREEAITKNYPLISVLCSSQFSARICKSMGLKLVYSLPYSEYKDESGNIVFVIPEPHNEIGMYIQKLQTSL